MTKDEKARMREAYELLKGILSEKAGTKRVGSQKKALTVEAALLAVLRKKVAGGGSHLAFQTLTRYESFRPPNLQTRPIHIGFDVVEFYANQGILRLPYEWSTPALTEEVWAAHVQRLKDEFRKGSPQGEPRYADPSVTLRKWRAIGL